MRLVLDRMTPIFFQSFLRSYEYEKLRERQTVLETGVAFAKLVKIILKQKTMSATGGQVTAIFSRAQTIRFKQDEMKQILTEYRIF